MSEHDQTSAFEPASFNIGNRADVRIAALIWKVAINFKSRHRKAALEMLHRKISVGRACPLRAVPYPRREFE